jgi:hypothetical protein
LLRGAWVNERPFLGCRLGTKVSLAGRVGGCRLSYGVRGKVGC